MDPRMTYGRPMAADSVTVSYTGTAGNTTAAPPNTTCVRLVSSTDCFVEIGVEAVAAATTGLYLVAGIPEYFACEGGERISAVQVTAGGNIWASFFS